jgi:transcription antitermination protein NusB
MSRRKARERALQVLFQVDLGGVDPKEAFAQMDEDYGRLDGSEDFTAGLVFGVMENSEFIDGVISAISKDWSLDRIANVDRIIMRLALYEVFFCADIPNNVSVNEAIELGKMYGGNESGKFINGILGKVIENIEEYTPQKPLEQMPDAT